MMELRILELYVSGIVKQILEYEDLISLRENPDKFREIQRKVSGKQLTITGKVNKNAFFNRLEITANSCAETNPKELAVELQKN